MTTLKPRSETVILWQGDDLARLNELRDAVEAAEESGLPRRNNELDPAAEAVNAYNAFRDEASERAVHVVVQQLGHRRRWRQLQGEHPPREGNQIDQRLGYNSETFVESVLMEPDTITAPGDIIAAAAREEFLDSLNDGNFETLAEAVFKVNRGRGEAPKAVRLFEQTSTHNETMS